MFYRSSKRCAGENFFRKVNRILTGVFEWRVLAFLMEVWYASVVKERYRKATVRLWCELQKKQPNLGQCGCFFYVCLFCQSVRY